MKRGLSELNCNSDDSKDYRNSVSFHYVIKVIIHFIRF
jgi:hypothetical protein